MTREEMILLSQLPPRYLEAYQLRVYEGKTVTEIAKLLKNTKTGKPISKSRATDIVSRAVGYVNIHRSKDD